ncbi:chloroplast protein FOR GROWTH AND FERTILITY 2-like [Wolffia australiana]
MERLVSSSLLSSRAAPLRPRLLLPPRAASHSAIAGRIGFVSESGCVFLSERKRLPSLLPCSPSSARVAVRCSGDASRGLESADVPDRPSAGRTGFQALRNKALIMLAAVAVTFLGRPAYGTVQLKTGGVGLAKAELLSSAWAGFLTGCLHTLSGPDHLAALAPLSIGRTRLESAAVGALWGCGHDAGQLLFGLLFLVLKDRLHIEVLRTWGTRVVGLTLLAIGAMGIREATEMPMHAPCVGVDVEAGVGQAKPKKKIGFATFATGIVHGLQPDALMMVLPALALPSRLAGAAFLAMFLLGTVVAMGSYTVFLGSCSEALKDRIPRVTEKLTWASSILAISMGLAIIVSQYFGFSLY